MNNLSKNVTIKKSRWIHDYLFPIAIIMCLLGVLLLFISNVEEGFQWIVGQLGTAIFVAGILSILYLLFIGRDPRIPERGIGLRKAFKDRNDLSFHVGGLFNLLQKASREFIAVGTTLADFVDVDARESLRQAAVNFLERIHRKQSTTWEDIKKPYLIMVIQDPLSPFLSQRGKEQNETDGESRIRRRVADGLEGIKWLLENLPHYLQRYVEVRFSKAMPLCSMFIIDRNVVYINFYKYGERQSTWFQFEQTDGSIIGEYIDNYEELERLSAPVSLEQIKDAQEKLQNNRTELR